MIKNNIFKKKKSLYYIKVIYRNILNIIKKKRFKIRLDYF